MVPQTVVPPSILKGRQTSQHKSHREQGQYLSDLCSHPGIRMQDAQECHQHCDRDRRAIMDVVKHKTSFSYQPDQETLYFRLKYNQIHVSKTNSQNKTPCYIIKVYFSLLLQHISPPKIQKQLPRILCCCHKCSFCGS